MAAAVAARERGVEDVLLLERHAYLGGVLPQCIHNGFGTQLYGKDYTGGEYAWLWKGKTERAGVTVMTGTTVLSLSARPEGGWLVTCVSAKLGAGELEAEAVIIATGCRERTLPQMLIPGSRPAGVFTAGAAQLMMNLKNYLPGKSAVILGSGDIGLIMARRMTLEGIRVKLILGQEATGLARNIVQCVEDYRIPMRYGWTVVSTHGYERLKGVSIAPFGEDGKPDHARKEYIPCDTLLVAAGLIPELEICRGLKPDASSEMDYEELTACGLFLCGNANYVHDLVDHVTAEGIAVGQKAAAYLGKDAAAAERLREFRGAEQSAEEAGGIKETAAAPPAWGAEPTGKQGNMVCTVCPQSCIMNVQSNPFSVTGNQCPKGERFARQELETPKRVLTTVVKAGDSIVSVRTDKLIDKADLFPVMKAVRSIHVKTPVTPGQVVAEDIAGTGANLIATWQAE